MLLLFLDVQRVLAQAGTVLHQLQLFAAWLALQRVVMGAGLFTDEKHGFGFLLTLGHCGNSDFTWSGSKETTNYSNRANRREVPFFRVVMQDLENQGLNPAATRLPLIPCNNCFSYQELR